MWPEVSVPRAELPEGKMNAIVSFMSALVDIAFVMLMIMGGIIFITFLLALLGILSWRRFQ